MIRWPGFRRHKPQAVPDGTQAALGTSAGNRVRCVTGEAGNLRKQRCSLARRHFLILPGLHPGNHPNIPVCSPLQYAPQQPVSSVPVIVKHLFQNDTAVPGEESRGDAQINPAAAHMVLIVPCTIPHNPGTSFFIVVIRRHPFFCKKRVLHRPHRRGLGFPSSYRPTAERRPQKSGIGTSPIMGVQGWNLSVQNRFLLSSAQQEVGTKSPSVRRTVSPGLCWQPGEVVQSGIPEEVPGMNPYYAVFLPLCAPNDYE